MKQGSLTKALLLGPSASKQGRDEFEAGGRKFCVDTCYANDVESYETCVFTDDNGGCNVEHYKTAKKAAAGHAKWVAALKADPSQELTDQIEYGL